MSATSVSLQPQELSEHSPSFATTDGGNTEQQLLNEQEAFYFPITQRDPNDVRTILRLAFCALGFALLTFRARRSAHSMTGRGRVQGVLAPERPQIARTSSVPSRRGST